MRLKLCVVLAALVPAAAAAAPVEEIVIQVDVGRSEIERILAADGNTERLTPRQVVDRMAAIPRGRAPGDFWRAYQRHLDAWQRLADAKGDEQIAAERAVDRSFDEVERIALRHGARMPQPL